MEAHALNARLLQHIRQVRHGFFTRRGGVSEGIFAALNCGFGSGDDMQRITENRRRVERALHAEHFLRTLYQVHSATVVPIHSPGDWEKPPEGDALITTVPGVPIGILTADCAPVLFADDEGRIVGAAHAGWKGAFGGVIEATVAAMVRCGVKRRAIRAAIGPCIAQPSYEVGPEFRDRFLAEDAAGGAFFIPSRRGERFQFDLPGFVRRRLADAGVDQVETLAADTCLEEDQFFSYRRATLRGEAQYGRQVSAIMITP